MKYPVIYDANTKIWSNPTKVLPTKMCLGERILKKLDEKDPNKIIEINYDNGKSLIASELKKIIISAAQNLLNLGIKKGDVILFFNEFNSLTTPIVFACYLVGAAICPIELNLTDDNADYIIRLLNPQMILYDPVFQNRIESTIKRIALHNLKYVLSFESRNDGHSVPQMLCFSTKSIHEFEVPELGDPDFLVGALMLTSGTTGKPKVICLSHSQISLGVHTYWTTDSNSVLYVPTSFRWITPVIFMLLPIFEESYRVFSGQILTSELCLDIIKKCEVTHFFAVVGLVTKIFQYAEQHNHGADLKTLRYVSIGGEPFPILLDKLIKCLMPKCNFSKCYGMTELAGCITTNLNVVNKKSGGGYLYPGLSVKIIDDQNNTLGPNQNGQVYIKGIVPYLKYLKNDKVNDEVFVDEWFITGDYGKFDDENVLHIFNRYKDLIRCEQYIVIPSILEKYLAYHKAIDVSYVVGIPDNNKGEIPVAFIKLNSNISRNLKCLDDLIDDIILFLQSVLPSSQIPPEKIYFLEKFSYTTCGKIDKTNLKQWLLDK